MVFKLYSRAALRDGAFFNLLFLLCSVSAFKIFKLKRKEQRKRDEKNQTLKKYREQSGGCQGGGGWVDQVKGIKIHLS